jgi:hypothetical protein
MFTSFILSLRVTGIDTTTNATIDAVTLSHYIQSLLIDKLEMGLGLALELFKRILIRFEVLGFDLETKLIPKSVLGKRSISSTTDNHSEIDVDDVDNQQKGSSSKCLLSSNAEILLHGVELYHTIQDREGQPSSAITKSPQLSADFQSLSLIHAYNDLVLAFLCRLISNSATRSLAKSFITRLPALPNSVLRFLQLLMYTGNKSLMTNAPNTTSKSTSTVELQQRAQRRSVR